MVYKPYFAIEEPHITSSVLIRVHMTSLYNRRLQDIAIVMYLQILSIFSLHHRLVKTYETQLFLLVLGLTLTGKHSIIDTSDPSCGQKCLTMTKP